MRQACRHHKARSAAPPGRGQSAAPPRTLPALVTDRRGPVILDATARPHEPEADADCWLVPVYLTPEEARTLRGMQ